MFGKGESKYDDFVKFGNVFIPLAKFVCNNFPYAPSVVSKTVKYNFVGSVLDSFVKIRYCALLAGLGNETIPCVLVPDPGGIYFIVFFTEASHYI